MDLKAALIFVAIFGCFHALGKEDTAPQVFENVDEDVDANARVIREPFSARKSPKFYKPMSFNYRSARQQDPRKHRYAQQQLSDLRSIYKRSHNLNDGVPLRLILGQKWRVSDLKASSSNVEEKRVIPKQKISETHDDDSSWEQIPLITTRKPISSRKLKPESFFEDADFESLKTDRQDEAAQVIYVHPNLIKDQIKNTDDLEALNALIGQSPDTQLQGLKKLLESPQQNFILPPIKGPQPFQVKNYTPIKEDALDIPNIKTNRASAFHAIQAKLDEVAKIQAQKALDEARKEAEAQVEAQHQAIAKAQADAQREAFAKIAAQNQEAMIADDSRSKASVYLQPQALALQGHEQATALLHAAQTEAILRAQAEKDATEAVLQAQKDAKLKKISITKTQSITKGVGVGAPKVVQEVVLETKHQRNVVPVEDDRQYAARYAFGYRIKDVKMGNDFGHEEKREGKSAKGHYHVLLPDGRLQKVEYYADPSGYHAKVTYENVAHHY